MSTANTVTVACKIPAGIFMQGYKMVPHQEPILGGGSRETEIAVPEGARVKINGPAAPQGAVSPHMGLGGYAMTHNVPADTAKAWLEANKDTPMVKNRLVFLAEKPEDVSAKARNAHASLSGLERLDVSTKSENGKQVPSDPRWPRSNNANITAVGTDTNK